MPPIIIDEESDGIVQKSPEWFALCLGNPGASNASRIVTNKGDRSKQADEYMRQLAGELIVGKAEETFQSIHMKNGIDRESEARVLFEMMYDVEVKQVAVVYKNAEKKFHVSPDGLIGNNEGAEIKAPMLKTQVKYLLDGSLPSEYFSQVQMSLYTSEREFWWFYSYYSGLPPLVIRVERDEEFIKKLGTELEQFVFELAVMVKRIKEMVNN